MQRFTLLLITLSICLLLNVPFIGAQIVGAALAYLAVRLLISSKQEQLPG